MELLLVSNTQQVLQSLHTFNSLAKTSIPRATDLLRQTWYWVFDSGEKSFGPSKFVGFVEMNFNRYEKAIKQPPRKAIFHGQRTKLAIEKATNMQFIPDGNLSEFLILWGERLVDSDVFAHVDREKWRFLRLH